jgi:hypothetical protein
VRLPAKHPLQACDECHRRKVKCYWRPPACPDCAKRGIACTFTKQISDSAKPKATTGLESAEARIRELEARLQEKSKETATQQENGHLNGHAPILIIDASITEQDGRKSAGSSSHPGEQDGVPEQAVEAYFHEANRLFPLMYDPSWSDQPAATKEAVRSMYHRKLVEAEASAEVATRYCRQADESLHLSVEAAKDVILSVSSLANIQALLWVYLCLQASRNAGHHDQSGVLIAAAAKMAHQLRYHRLDSIPSLSYAQRVEAMRMFWSLFILDREHSLRTDDPLLLDVSDLEVMIEPPKDRPDGLGVVESLDKSMTINVYAARQRLAKVVGKVQKELRTFRGLWLNDVKRRETAAMLQAELAAWKVEWFEYGNAKDLSKVWYMDAFEEVVALQRTFFMCLVKGSPDLPTTVEAVEAFVERCRSQDPEVLDQGPLTLLHLRTAKEQLRLCRNRRRVSVQCLM